MHTPGKAMKFLRISLLKTLHVIQFTSSRGLADVSYARKVNQKLQKFANSQGLIVVTYII